MFHFPMYLESQVVHNYYYIIIMLPMKRSTLHRQKKIFKKLLEKSIIQTDDFG